MAKISTKGLSAKINVPAGKVFLMLLARWK